VDLPTDAARTSPATSQPPSTSTHVPPQKSTLVVFGAGSLILPFQALEKAFESRYPNIDVQAEYHGSIQVMRHATELHQEIDVVATADASLIPMLMYATQDPDTGRPYADWYIRFATNRLAIAYTPRSKYAGEINGENWATILARPDIKVGIADPRFDASGYRALMAFALEQERTGQSHLFSEMFNERFTSPITIFWDDDGALITVPEIIETKPGSPVVIRGASIQLIALLESGDLDYAFEYESVIQQHNLELLRLPDETNLGEEGFDYGTVQVNLDFQRFATVQPVFRGERIGYGITIPENAGHPSEAALFIAYLLGPEGRTLMESYHHPMFDPVVIDGAGNLPSMLKDLLVP
jgi:molybdate/tungstate transport system substrate-binding protein